MYKNIAVTLQLVERARRLGTDPATAQTCKGREMDAGANEPSSAKLGPMQKIVALGPLP
jgi:hypothetical protein